VGVRSRLFAAVARSIRPLQSVSEKNMNSTLKMLRLMTDINIGATLALLAWLATHVTARGGV